MWKGLGRRQKDPFLLAVYLEKRNPPEEKK